MNQSHLDLNYVSVLFVANIRIHSCQPMPERNLLGYWLTLEGPLGQEGHIAPWLCSRQGPRWAQT